MKLTTWKTFIQPVILTGISDFDPSTAVYNLVSYNQNPILEADCFITKLDLDGGFVWAKQFGGPGTQHGADMALDRSGDLYVAGDFTAPTDFDPGAGVSVVDGKTSGSTFITKLTVQGDFLWARALSPVTMGQSLTSSMTCDKMGNVYLAGAFGFAVDFDPGDGQFILDGEDMYDMFLLKLRADGSFVSVLNFGNSNAICLAANVALDSHDNIYVNGFFRYSIDFDPTANTHILSTNGLPNGYLLKLGHCLLETSESVTICEGSEYKGYTTGGTYADTLFSTTGCDSVHTIQLQVNPATRKTVDVSICQGETYFTGGSNQTVPGTYLDTLTNFLGCDSIITTKLTVNPNPVPDLGADGSICANSMQLSPGLFASYKWQDQSTSSAFTANGPGIFWVEVTDANHCVAVDTIDIATILQVPFGFLKDADSLCRYQTLPLRSTSDFQDYLWSTGSHDLF